VEAGIEPAWYDLKELMNEMDGYSSKTDIWYLADYILHDERKFIDRNKLNFTVRLTQLGRDHCGQKINHIASGTRESWIFNRSIPDGLLYDNSFGFSSLRLKDSRMISQY
jgi:hypothetical protein